VEAAVTFSIPPSGPSVAPPTSSVLARIEKELREMWTAPAQPGEAPKSRICTMNLVVAAGTRDLADRYTPVLDEVTSSIPSRAILVALDPESPVNALEGDASAVCSLGEGGTKLCSERVRLNASGSVCVRVGSTVDALLVPEIPTTLVWLGRVHVEDAVFLSMANQAHRVVLDTEYTSLASLLQLARWKREEPGRPALADLAWTRLATWQELCARFFDEPRLRAHAMAITRITIRQASEKGARLGSEGALLLGWLGTRLGWKTVRMGGALRFQRPDGKSVGVQLGAVPRPEGVAPAALAGIVIEADAGGAKIVGSIDRDLASGSEMEGKSPDADVVLWKLEVAGQPAIEQRVRLRANRGARVLERTLHRPTSDPALTESVAFAEQFFEDGMVVG
jgi:glucose-6-phosphate dehydrogenase assembly protein OpcA